MTILHNKYFYSNRVYYNKVYYSTKKQPKRLCRKRRYEKAVHRAIYIKIFSIIKKVKPLWSISKVQKMSVWRQRDLYRISRTFEEYANLNTLYARLMGRVKILAGLIMTKKMADSARIKMISEDASDLPILTIFSNLTI